MLERFSAPTREWFRSNFDAPTAAQTGAWEAVSEGRHALVVAPTGSGKTLAAFLWALDRLAFTASSTGGCRVLYVSPLKALAVDVERNLRSPLVGIGHAAVRLGLPRPEVRVSVRSGDTPAEERRAFARNPSDILITTPESLFLLLTSAAREALRGVETVILDEVHAVAGTKRGAHLALSLERLDTLLSAPAQRIGLSATVRPVEEVARFLAGGRPVQVVAPPIRKRWELAVVVPVPDLGAIGTPTGDLSGPAAGEPGRTSIWPHVEERIVDEIAGHRSTLVFVNSRRLAERLTARLNEIWGERVEAGPIPGLDEGSPLARHAGAGEASSSSAIVGQHLQTTQHNTDSQDTLPSPLPPRPPTLRAPAQVMAQSAISLGAPAVLARAHHGSVSREQRTLIEEDLKAGRLPAVVATSSLELGIDMGAVDLVIQVEAPPSVASGLQRVGRAGHQVGAVSHGVLFPKFRGDLVQTAVIVERMREGAIESLAVPANPLDVLAQQVVAMVALDSWTVDALHDLLRRSAPFATLTRPVLESVLDMLSGRYPSEEFAELRPRLVWDRLADTLTGRRNAQRLAVTSGGTIPDRGLYGVFLAGGEGPGRRVGELDEEMVYESRVGDVFALGTSSWRIEDITHDRVLVTPAPGVPARLPFWKGDSLGRPAELGRAVGAFVAEVAGLPAAKARRRVTDAGLDEWAADNLLGYLAEQQEATGTLPSDRRLLVERFRDELGDWQVVVHSPFGSRVHAPWALLAAARLRERYGVDVQAMHADDGMVFRLPDTGWDDEPDAPRRQRPDWSEELLETILPEPDDLPAAVTAQLGGSALFASRFRECAGRALLLPKRRPDRRQALWQQRQRAAQLLEVASQYPSFPIVLEAVRECVNDVFDVPALAGVLRAVRSREIAVVSVETPRASPFAASLLFGYVAQFLYEGDSPLAEKRAAALALDPSLLADLLGTSEGLALADLLDPEALTRTEAELQGLAEGRRARDADELGDLLRTLGPLTAAELAARSADPEAVTGWLADLEAAHRVIAVRLADRPCWAAVEDAGRLRDGLGVPLPMGVPQAFTDPVDDPLGELLGRYARTHAPFTLGEAAGWLGLGHAVARDVLRRLVGSGRLVEGELRPPGWVGTGAGYAAGSVAGPEEPTLRQGALPGAAAAEPEEPTLRQAQGSTTPEPAARPDDPTLRQAQGAFPGGAAQGALPPGATPGSSTPGSSTLGPSTPGSSTLGPSTPGSSTLGPSTLGQSTLGAAQFCDARVLRLLRRRSLAALRDATEPVATGDFARFLPSWQGFGELRGVEGTYRAVEQLAGLPVPASALEALILPARVRDYRPALLDELTAGGDVLWQGHGSLGGGDGWVSLHPAELAGATLAPPGAVADELAGELLAALSDGGGHFFRALADRLEAERAASDRPGVLDDGRLTAALWGLVWAGLATNDTLVPLRALLGQAATTHRTRPAGPTRSRYGRGLRGAVPRRPSLPQAAGRWSALPEPVTDPTIRAAATAEVLLNRYGVVTRGSVAAEEVPGGFAGVYRVLAAAEEAGRLRRGYFVERLGAAQFAALGAVDRLRGLVRPVGTDPPGKALVLAACDPANPYGAALPWPQRETGGTGRGHQPGRKAGALVVLVDGDLVLYVERGGRTLLSWSDQQGPLTAAATALAAAVHSGALGTLTVAKVDGEAALGSGHPLALALEAAGFRLTPRGLRLRR